MKRYFFPAVFFLFAVNLYSVEFVESASPKSNSYVMYVNPCDFGPVVDKVVLHTEFMISQEEVKPEDFDITVYANPKDSVVVYGIVKGGRRVKEAYLSDETGNPSVQTTGHNITLWLQYSPDDELATPFNDQKILDMEELYNYKITNQNLRISITHRTAVVCKEVLKFKTDSCVYGEGSDEIKMNYASYVPEGTSSKIPLIVFFHGMGEVGKNIYMPLLKIKSTALAQSSIQKYFGEGAAVLIPQCPTGWMEITDLDPFGNRLWVVVDIGGTLNRVTAPVTNFLNKLFLIPESQQVDRVVTPVSYYTLAAKDLIDKFIRENPQIDKNRIYVGGCSAGGFMTVNMMLQYPDYFAAAFPICEAFPDARINSRDLAKIAQKPMWFVLAKNDPTINPEKNTMPTVNRLKKMGAKNLHYSYFDKVEDVTGKYFNADKTAPHEYHGHDSWIYVFNDYVREGGLSLFEWLASQTNSD